MNTSNNIEYYLKLPWTKEFIDNGDGSYFAKIKELKGCMTEGKDLLDANNMLDDALKCWLEVAIEKNISIPEPGKEADLNQFSGKFLVRVPKSIHKALIEKAHQENVSLNAMVNCIIARSIEA
jgi:antitoxin HicB